MMSSASVESQVLQEPDHIVALLEACDDRLPHSAAKLSKAKAKERMRVKVKVKEHARAMGRVRAKKMVRENVVVAAIDEIIRWTAWLSQSQRLRVGRELYWTVV